MTPANSLRVATASAWTSTNTVDNPTTRSRSGGATAGVGDGATTGVGGKKAMNKYPEHEANISVYDFVKDENQGLSHIIEFMNNWARELPKIEQLLVVRYEDLRSSPEREMGRIVEFLGMEANEEYLKDTAEFASVENLRKKEQENYFWRSGSRVQAKDVNDPNTFKVRKAKVGGYRDYFDDDQVAELDAMVDSRLLPVFGYTAAENTGG